MKYVAVALATILVSPGQTSDVQQAWDEHLACREVETNAVFGHIASLAAQEPLPTEAMREMGSVLDAQKDALAALYKLRVAMIRQGLLTQEQRRATCPSAPETSG